MNRNPLTGEDREALVSAARQAAAAAYAPHSDYRVGAAVLSSFGETVSGCNVENSSYGLSICAERNAIFAARARGLVDPSSAPLRAVAIHTPQLPTGWPCGACRQVLREFADESCLVIVDSPEGRFESTLGELLPHGFRLGDG
ncbi:MAG: cytidine deaminase [Gemmatimonadota bacterium]|nr:MAG: cytidine deaminase [Gemmatimonadota bacterium]